MVIETRKLVVSVTLLLPQPDHHRIVPQLLDANWRGSDPNLSGQGESVTVSEYYDRARSDLVFARKMRLLEQSRSEEIRETMVRARRTDNALEAYANWSKSCNSCVSDESKASLRHVGGHHSVKEYARALARLATVLACEADWPHLYSVARSEVNGYKADEAVVLTMVVKHKNALASDNPDREKWLKAISKELGGLEEKVLEVCPYPRSRALTNFYLRYCFKARVVACGNFQKVTEGDVCSGVEPCDVWLDSILLDLKRGWGVSQVEISQVFRQTDLDDDVFLGRTFLGAPKTLAGYDGKVWKVVRSVYGLKSALRAWQLTLHKTLRSWSLSPPLLDNSVCRIK